MAAKSSVWAKTRDLFARVATDGVRKSGFQTSPGLSTFLNRRNFFYGKTCVGIEERNREICPERFTAEIGDMDVVPGRLALLTCKRVPRMIARLDELAIGGLYRDPAGLENSSLVLPGGNPW